MLHFSIQNCRGYGRTRWILEPFPACFQAPMARVKGWKIQQQYRFTTASLDGKNTLQSGQSTSVGRQNIVFRGTKSVYGDLSRKNKLSGDGLTVMLLIPPESSSCRRNQPRLEVARLPLVWTLKLPADDGHEMVTVESGGLRVIVRKGVPGVCTTPIKLQNPPVTE